MSKSIATTPEPPYYAVIFSSTHKGTDPADYRETSEQMLTLAEAQPGFLGVESAREEDALGITVSYWRDLESIARWKSHSQHQSAQQKGRSTWYENFKVRIAKVERSYGM